MVFIKHNLNILEQQKKLIMNMKIYKIFFSNTRQFKYSSVVTAMIRTANDAYY